MDDELDIVLDDTEEMNSDYSSYILNVAKSSSYQNQTEKYYADYGEWRTKKNNPYGYAYVKDVREKTYVDGKGFVSDGPDKAERKALGNCFKLVAMLMIFSQLLTLIEYFVIAHVKGVSFYSFNFFDYSSNVDKVSFDVLIISCVINILRLLVPIIAFFFVTKMPLSVALPKSKVKDYELAVVAISFMLMVTIMGRTANFALGKLFESVGLGYSDFMVLDTTDAATTVVYAICEFIITPVLMEILFRGIILQLFRQFGDMFAVSMACIMNVLYFNDFTTIGYSLLSAVIVGLFTLRSGSIYTAIAMRISTRLVIMVVSIGISYLDTDTALFVEEIVSLTIISFALSTYNKMVSHKPWDFNVTDSYTHLSTKSKFVVMFSCTAMIVWMVFCIVIMILNVRFV